MDTYLIYIKERIFNHKGRKVGGRKEGRKEGEREGR